MKASILIEKLQDQIKESGDLEVMITVPDDCPYDMPADQIEIRQYKGFSPYILLTD